MKRHFVIFCLLIISLKLQSQNLGNISGKIFSNETGLILEGATIQIENSNFFSITDENGYFQINFFLNSQNISRFIFFYQLIQEVETSKEISNC